MEFLREIEDHYGFEAEVFCAEGVPVGDKEAYDKKYGANLWREDIEQYDKVCKVEPFQRGLKTLGTDCMINGRTRWQGFERAWIDQFEGDPVPWLDYASERKGRFVGLANKDGSTKTECGIHVEGAEKTFDRDLWDKSSKVKTLDSEEDVLKLKKSGKPAIVVVYAPWCQFCQKMEDDFDKFASESDVDVYKFRGDEVRDFVSSELNTSSFPTVNAIKSDGATIKYD